jgi:hypothetical protein
MLLSSSDAFDEHQQAKDAHLLDSYVPASAKELQKSITEDISAYCWRIYVRQPNRLFVAASPLYPHRFDDISHSPASVTSDRAWYLSTRSDSSASKYRFLDARLTLDDDNEIMIVLCEMNESNQVVVSVYPLDVFEKISYHSFISDIISVNGNQSSANLDSVKSRVLPIINSVSSIYLSDSRGIAVVNDFHGHYTFLDIFNDDETSEDDDNHDDVSQDEEM